jgi:hypothetical protein
MSALVLRRCLAKAILGRYAKRYLFDKRHGVTPQSRAGFRIACA